MVRTRLLVLGAVAGAVLLSAPPTRAADAPAAAACTAPMDAHLPAPLAAWPRRTAVAAAATAAGLPQAPLWVARPVNAMLRPNAEVVFPARPDRPGGAETFGGLLDITILAAGDYQVELGTDAWIDVVRDGALVASTAHAHGPDCTTIRKMVVFPLKAGHSVLEITGANGPVVGVMVTRVVR